MKFNWSREVSEKYKSDQYIVVKTLAKKTYLDIFFNYWMIKFTIVFMLIKNTFAIIFLKSINPRKFC